MTSISESAARADEAVFLDRLAHLRRCFVERTRRNAAAFRALRDRWQNGEPLTGELLEALRRMAHGLAGAAGVFGFDAVSDAAHRLQDALRAPDPSSIDPTPLFDALEAELAALCSSDAAL